MSELSDTQLDRLVFAAEDALRKLAKDPVGQSALCEQMALYWAQEIEFRRDGRVLSDGEREKADSDEAAGVALAAPCDGRTGEAMAAHFVAIDSFPKDTTHEWFDAIADEESAPGLALGRDWIYARALYEWSEKLESRVRRMDVTLSRIATVPYPSVVSREEFERVREEHSEDIKKLAATLATLQEAVAILDQAWECRHPRVRAPEVSGAAV